jgi:hypothetical protein
LIAVFNLDRANFEHRSNFKKWTKVIVFFFSLALQPQFGPWPTSMKLSVPLRFSRS